MEIQDIEWFYKKCNRSQNDYINKIRENVINNILNIPSEFSGNPKWKYITVNLIQKIKEMYKDKTGQELDISNTFTISAKAGRGNRHDFVVTFSDETEIKLEFKYGTNIYKYPQFLSIYLTTLPDIIDRDFIKYWYDNWLQEYTESLEIKTPIPPYEEYKKNINNTNYSHPFFNEIYNAIKNLTTKHKYNAIHKQAIKEYLALENKINMEILQKELHSQKEKYFLFCNNGEFTYEKISDHMTLKEHCKCTKNNIIFNTTSGKKIKCLLRWKNRNGCAGPAWQISLRHR